MRLRFPQPWKLAVCWSQEDETSKAGLEEARRSSSRMNPAMAQSRTEWQSPHRPLSPRPPCQRPLLAPTCPHSSLLACCSLSQRLLPPLRIHCPGTPCCSGGGSRWPFQIAASGGWPSRPCWLLRSPSWRSSPPRDAAHPCHSPSPHPFLWRCCTVSGHCLASPRCSVTTRDFFGIVGSTRHLFSLESSSQTVWWGWRWHWTRSKCSRHPWGWRQSWQSGRGLGYHTGRSGYWRGPQSQWCWKLQSRSRVSQSSSTLRWRCTWLTRSRRWEGRPCTGSAWRSTRRASSQPSYPPPTSLGSSGSPGAGSLVSGAAAGGMISWCRQWRWSGAPGRGWRTRWYWRTQWGHKRSERLFLLLLLESSSQTLQETKIREEWGRSVLWMVKILALMAGKGPKEIVS